MNLLEALGYRPAWQADALCKEHPEVDFFPERGQSARHATAVCARCIVRAECQQYALEAGPLTPGVWGGMSARDRRRLIAVEGRPGPSAPCTVCGGPMPATATRRAKYCSASCSTKAARTRRRTAA